MNQVKSGTENKNSVKTGDETRWSFMDAWHWLESLCCQVWEFMSERQDSTDYLNQNRIDNTAIAGIKCGSESLKEDFELHLYCVILRFRKS